MMDCRVVRTCQSVLPLKSPSLRRPRFLSIKGVLPVVLSIAVYWIGADTEVRADLIYTVHLTAYIDGISGPIPNIPTSPIDLSFSFDSADIDGSADSVAGAAFTSMLLATPDFTSVDFIASTSLLDLNGVTLPMPGASPVLFTPGSGTELDFANASADINLSRSLTITAGAAQLMYTQQNEGPPQMQVASTNQLTWTISATEGFTTPEPTSSAIWAAFAAATWRLGRRKRVERTKA